MDSPSSRHVTVWDPLVRVGHWLLVIACVVAYLSEGDPMLIHSWAGYVVAGYIVVRVAWGFFGPREARFASFLYAPRRVFGYLRDLLGFRARRYLGHSPAGGAMAIALLLSLTATVTTGMLGLGDQAHVGPLAFLFPAPMASSELPTAADQPLFPSLDVEDDQTAEEAAAGPRRRPKSEFVEIHELFVNLTLALVILHIGGVVLASIAHRENLVRAMVSGRKRLD